MDLFVESWPLVESMLAINRTKVLHSLCGNVVLRSAVVKGG